MATAFGVMLTIRPGEAPSGGRWDALAARAAEAAEAGVATLGVPDHLDFPEGARNLEAWTTLAALATAVPSVTLLPLVLSSPLRAPGLVASMAATLDEIAPGRVMVGLGAGVDEREHRQAGAAWGTPAERVAAVEATATSIRARCGGAVPLVIAGGGPRMIDLAARHGDEWNCGMMEAHRRRELLDALDRACERSGRAVRRSVLASVLGGDPPSGEMARRYNLDLALRGRTGAQLVDEVQALLSVGFSTVHLVSHSATAWQSILEALPAMAATPGSAPAGSGAT